MSLSNNLDRVAFLTLYPVDKIVETETGSFSVSNNAVGSTSFSHSLGRAVFSEMLYSIDNVNFYMSGQRIAIGSGYVFCTQEVSSSGVNIFAENYNTGATRTIYYRIAFIWNT